MTLCLIFVVNVTLKQRISSLCDLVCLYNLPVVSVVPVDGTTPSISMLGSRSFTAHLGVLHSMLVILAVHDRATALGKLSWEALRKAHL